MMIAVVPDEHRSDQSKTASARAAKADEADRAPVDGAVDTGTTATTGGVAVHAGPATPGVPGAGVSAEAFEDDEGAQYTIDEIASLSGVPSRTIRFYQSKGTLPAPQRRGRVAFYSDEHLERLKVIAELQDRGLRLDAIRDALQQIEKGGDSLQQWLGVSDNLQSPWSDDQPIVVTEAEMLERVGGRLAMIAELQRVGTIKRQGNSRPASYIVSSPGLLDIALRLDDAGIDAATAFEASEIMRRPIAKMSEELVEFFTDRAGQGFGGAGQPEGIARSFQAVQPLGLQAIQLIFAQEMERALRQFVEQGGAIPRPKSSRPTDTKSRTASKRTDRKSERRDHRHSTRPD